MKLPFGKKKEAGVASAPMSSKQPAINRVDVLSSQGLSEPEIIRELRAEGYSPMEVDNAMKQALRTAVDSPQPPPPGYPQANEVPPPIPGAPELEASPQPPTAADRRRIFPEEAPPPPRSGAPRPPLSMNEMRRMEKGGLELPELPGSRDTETIEPLPGEGLPEDEFRIPGIDEEMQVPEPRSRSRAPIENRRMLEEMAEAVVDERSDVFRREVDEVAEEIKKLVAKIQVIEERLNQMDSRKRTEVHEIKDSIGSYKESMTDVSARMEAVERAMKDNMAPMMQTLRSLSDAVRDIKSK
jgi:hypothetical protein